MKSFLYRIAAAMEPVGKITRVHPKQPRHYLNVQNGCFMSRLEVSLLVEAANHYGGTFLEVGCNHGATAANICRLCPSVDVIGIDMPVEMGTTMHKNQCTEQPEMSQAGNLAMGYANFHMIYGNSRTVPMPKDLSIIFIDGDHTYEGVKADTIRALNYAKQNRNLKMIIWHDYGNDQHPEYIGVDKYLDEEIATKYDLRQIAGTWLAFIEVNQ